MAGNSNGLPYPTGTDFVVNGDNAIRALAEAVDARVAFRMATGQFTTASAIATGGNLQVPITFPAGRFTVAPFVFLTLSNNRSNLGIEPTITKDAATVSISNWSSGTMGAGQIVKWVAIQFKPNSSIG